MFIGEQSEAQKALKIFDDLVDGSGDVVWTTKTESNHENWYDWHGNSTDPVASSSFVTSRLIQKENIANEDAKATLTNAILAT